MNKQMRKIYITQTEFSRNSVQLRKLNDLILLHRTLSPGLITGATGCSRTDALSILVILWENFVADGVIYAHLKLPPHEVVAKRNFEEGPPKLPLIVEIDDDTEQSVTVNDIRDLFFRIEFNLREKVVFSAETN